MELMELIIVRKNKNMDNIEKIIFGKLTNNYMGYKKDAKFFGILNPERTTCFLIINDIEDENYGYILNVGKSLPEIEIIKTVETVETSIKFWSFYGLIVEKVKIPTTLELLKFD